jgi:histone-arginine methyltransferase CARM1
MLWTQTNAKVRFWDQPDFYGVDFSVLSSDAKAEVFGIIIRVG